MIEKTNGANDWLDLMKMKHYGKETDCRTEGSSITIFLKATERETKVTILGDYCKVTGQGKVFSGPLCV